MSKDHQDIFHRIAANMGRVEDNVHAKPNPLQSEKYQDFLVDRAKENHARYEQEREQASIEAHFQAQENFLKHDVEPLHNSDWNYTVPDDFRTWDSNQQLGYLYKMLCASNNKDANPENLHINRQVFEQAINELPGDVPIEIISQLRIAYDHPEKIGEINVDKLIGVRGNHETWIRGENLNHKEERGGGKELGRFLAGYEQSIHEYNLEPVDCDMDHVIGLDRDGRAALRAVISGDFKTADKLLGSKRCMEWTDDLVNAIKSGATVTEQTIESLNRMSKTDGAGKISGANLKDSQWNESSDGDVKQRSNKPLGMHWFEWK